jgi:gas vesicle protein
MSKKNPNRLFYSCKEKKCIWLGWCDPIPDEDVVQRRVDPKTNDAYSDATMGILEDEVNKVKKLVEGFNEAIQEEVARVKFEFDIGMSDMKKNVDDKLIVLQNEFKQEFLTLKTELKRMKQRNRNMKFAIFELMLVSVLFFISNHI